MGNVRMSTDGTCSVEGCDKPIRCRGLCNAHRLMKAEVLKRVNPCGCGCGGLTSSRFIWGHHTRLFTSAEQSRRGKHYDGSVRRDTGTKDTYRKVNHKHEHRTVAEQKIGRKLTSKDIVHHKDEIKRNNDPGNLEVMTRAEHIAVHREELIRARRAALADA